MPYKEPITANLDVGTIHQQQVDDVLRKHGFAMEKKIPSETAPLPIARSQKTQINLLLATILNVQT